METTTEAIDALIKPIQADVPNTTGQINGDLVKAWERLAKLRVRVAALEMQRQIDAAKNAQ